MIDDSTIILFVVIFIVLPVLLKIVWWFDKRRIDAF